MALLELPAEILDLADSQSVEFTVLRFEKGELRIETRLEPEGKIIPVLRLHVPPDQKPLGAPYWDVTSRTLQARLDPVLGSLIATRRRIRVTKFGVAPTARFQVEFL